MKRAFDTVPLDDGGENIRETHQWQYQPDRKPSVVAGLQLRTNTMAP